MSVFGHTISMPQLYGQLLIGLINGSFYALLSPGLAVIFGMLTIVNFAHGALLILWELSPRIFFFTASGSIIGGRSSSRR